MLDKRDFISFNIVRHCFYVSFKKEDLDVIIIDNFDKIDTYLFWGGENCMSLLCENKQTKYKCRLFDKTNLVQKG